MSSSLTWIITGLSVGFVYVLFSVGFNLTFAVMRCLNVAHASSFVVAALIACQMSFLDLPAPVLIPLILVVSTIAGVLCNLATQVLAIEPLLRRGTLRSNIEMASFLTTLGIFFIIESALLYLTNAQPLSFNAELLEIGSTSVLGIVLPNKYAVVGLGGALGLVAVMLLLRSKYGRYMRATADSRLLAGVLGINVRVTQRNAMIVAGALAGVAGVLIAYLYGQGSYGLAHVFLLKAIVIGIVGGLGSMTGATVVAIGLGIVEAGAVNYFGGAWQDATAFALIIIVLAIRPQGIFGLRERVQT